MTVINRPAATAASVTRVVNKHKAPYDVYIGRGSYWGNPYTVADYGREQCIELYERELRALIAENPQVLKDVLSLRGKTLGCFCKPMACHGDVLVKIINEHAGE